MCFHWNLPSSQCQSSPLYLSFVLHALEKDTRILNPKPSLLKVKPFGEVSDFSHSGFQVHIFFASLCIALQLWYSKFQILVGFITVSRTYIPFIQTKILISPLENHSINFWYVNPVYLILKNPTEGLPGPHRGPLYCLCVGSLHGGFEGEHVKTMLALYSLPSWGQHNKGGKLHGAQRDPVQNFYTSILDSYWLSLKINIIIFDFTMKSFSVHQWSLFLKYEKKYLKILQIKTIVFFIYGP